MRRLLPLVLSLPLLLSCEIFGPDGPEGSCQGPQAISVGSDITAEIGRDDCDGPGGTEGDVYTLSLTEPAHFLATMTPSGFKAEFNVFVGSLNGNPTRLLQQLGTGPTGAILTLPAGEYVIVAAPAESDGGSFRLQLGPVPEGCLTTIFGWGLRGGNATSTITANDCPGNGAARMEATYIPLNAGETLTVNLTANRPGDMFIRLGDSGPGITTRSFAANTPTTMTHTAATKGLYSVFVIGQPALTGPMNYTVQFR